MMKNIRAVIAAIAVATSGCASVHSPVNGFYYVGVKGPGGATGEPRGMKRGEAKATSILGLFAFGDASIETAARNAGITKITHVDYESQQVLGLFASFTTVVYGE